MLAVGDVGLGGDLKRFFANWSPLRGTLNVTVSTVIFLAELFSFLFSGELVNGLYEIDLFNTLVILFCEIFEHTEEHEDTPEELKFIYESLLTGGVYSEILSTFLSFVKSGY